MKQYIIRRVLISLVVLFGVSIMLYTLVRSMPSDYVDLSTSANVSGEPSPANFGEISETIKKGVDYIVGYRQEDKTPAEPSHIIKLGAGGLVRVIR